MTTNALSCLNVGAEPSSTGRDTSAPTLKSGNMRVRTIYLSLMLVLVFLAPSTQPAVGQSSDLSAPASTDQTAPALHGTLAVPVKQEPQPSELDKSQGQNWHRVTLQLNGSMCPACLLELEGKLSKLPGVAFAKITRPDAGQTDKDAAERIMRHRLADAVIIYDKHAIAFDLLHDVIKREMYNTKNISDTEFAP